MAIENDVTSAWGADVELLDGVEIVDKAELVGKPFLITQVWLDMGSNEVLYLYVNGVHQDGSTFTFNDSSTTGVKAQMLQHLVSKGIDLQPGAVQDVKIVIPRGLRVSVYDVSDLGRTKRAKTYYLTTSGRRPQR